MRSDCAIHSKTKVDAVSTRLIPTFRVPSGLGRQRLLVTWQLPLAAAAFAAALMVMAPRPALPQAGVKLVVVDVTTVAKGYRASKLKGETVVNDQNERIGTIDDIVIGRDRVLFAILQVGGFLGVGGHLVAVPYESLVLDDAGQKITLPGATKDQLKSLPEYKDRS
jgi:sporulation protein YlmC with PRC-barrel domain